MAYKILGMISEGTSLVYTVPEGKSTVVSKLVLFCSGLGESGATYNTFQVVVEKNYQQSVLFMGNLGERESWEMTGGITLAAGQKLYAYMDANSAGTTGSATLFGDES